MKKSSEASYRREERRYMRRALELGRRGLGLASPNPTVGCVVARQGKIVGEGYHDYAGRDHAEVRAIRAAGESARGATVYVTLEPCFHQGRTPPCTALLIRSGIHRVVAAMPDPNPRVSGKGIDQLRSAGVQVDVGLLSDEAARLIEPFACHVTSGRPLVVSKVGMSLDGRIATAHRADGWITSEQGREFGQKLRHELDAILVGSGTVTADDPELTYRGSRQKGRPLCRVVLDGRLRTPPTARVLQNTSQHPVLIFCSQGAASARRRGLEARGAEVIPVPGTGAGLDLHRVLQELGRRRMLGLLVEGGSAVHWSFLSERLVDKFYFIIAPLVLGGNKSVPSVGGEGYDNLADAPRFRIARTFEAGSDLVLEAYPSYSRSIISPWRVSASAPSCGPDSPPSSGPRLRQRWTPRPPKSR